MTKYYKYDEASGKKGTLTSIEYCNKIKYKRQKILLTKVER